MIQQKNHFQFAKNQHLDQVTVLQAEIDDFCYNKHAHEEFSFGITLTGRQDFFASGGFHHSHPGNIIIFNPEEVHDGHSGGDDTLQYRMLYIHPKQLAPLFQHLGIKKHQDYRIADKVIDDKLLCQYIFAMSVLIENKATDKLHLEEALYHIAVRIAQLSGHYSPEDKKRKVDKLLLRARDFIHENITSDISLDKICQQANLSKYHFLRMFRQQFGMTPHQYILNNRINRARDDLESGTALEDVVFNYRFSDLSHFNRRFKPIYGMTPRQYQQNFLKT